MGARTYARYARARYYAARSLPISLAFGAGARFPDLERADDSRKVEMPSARMPRMLSSSYRERRGARAENGIDVGIDFR